jgi:antitoxin (DNA-binding transcriptional repressor) of toxin-antitoxin stability system
MARSAGINWQPPTTGAYTRSVSEPARGLPVDEPKLLAEAVEDARLGVITHLTVHGERVAAIVPESMLDALRAAEDAAMDEPGESVSLEELEAEFGR